MGGLEPIEEVFLQSDLAIGNSRILIFARPKFLQLLKNTKAWLGDGTFKTAPPPFSQVFIIHAKWQDSHHTITCVYACLPNKKQRTYVAMLREIRRLVNDVAPESFGCDFEQALINAITTVFPAAIIYGCFFHFSQNFRHHLGEVPPNKKCL